MSVVVDASVIVALVVADERQDAVEQQIKDWLDHGVEMHAPAVLPYEIANVMARRVFDGLLEVKDVVDIWSDLAAIPLVIHPFEFGEDGATVAETTARMQRRHATDATYVCLAQRLGTKVYTLDRSLARNATALRLPVRLV